MKFSILQWHCPHFRCFPNIDANNIFDIDRVEIQEAGSSSSRNIFALIYARIYFPIRDRKSKETDGMDLFRLNATQRHAQKRSRRVTPRRHERRHNEREVVAARKALSATKATFERTGVPVKRQSRCDIECPDCLPLLPLSLSLLLPPSFFFLRFFLLRLIHRGYPFFSDGRPKCHPRS